MFPNNTIYSTLQQHDQAANNQITVFNLHLFQQMNYHVQHLIQREAFLLKQVKIMEKAVQNMKSNIQSVAASVVSKQFNLFIEKAQKTWKRTISFKKSQACPVEGCQHKYSSRIALRAHLKRKHQKKELENVQFKP